MYVAGWNKPGYMPEAEPAIFENFDEAKAYIVAEIERARELESFGDRENAKDKIEAFDRGLKALREKVDQPFSTGVMPDGYIYWVQED